MSNVISEETAQEQVDGLIDFYDIDISIMPENVQRAVQASIGKIKKAIMAGILEIEIDPDPGSVSSISDGE